MVGGLVDIAPSYPSDREPGEGIDAEDITLITNSECLQRLGQKRKSNEEVNKNRNDVEHDASGTEGSRSSHSPNDTLITTSIDDRVINPEDSPLMLSTEKAPILKPTVSLEDLKRENVMLRSELQDVREELQKRLEDLEAQRRAETEARTRLKQLSRKKTNQAVEREEKERELRTQLENEKAETERLRKDIASLEAELRNGRNEGDEEEKELNETKDDRESEMIELNIQLKNQLAEVKAQLALEQEERKREEEERKHAENADSDINKELSMKLVELMAEVEELKHKKKEDSQKAEMFSVPNSPLTYLTLHDDELNSNMVCSDNKLLPSPEQHLLFCQSTNQRNILMSTPTADVTQDDHKVIDVEHSPLLSNNEKGLLTSEREDVRQNTPDLCSSDLVVSDLAKELERLQRKYSKETERANEYQVKLEALQSQVNMVVSAVVSNCCVEIACSPCACVGFLWLSSTVHDF